MKKLGPKFFERPTLEVAPELVGKLFKVRQSSGNEVETRIVEVEAYRSNDPASHCSKGWTKRCAPMFEKPGRAYVYFIYGMYEMLNFVTEPEGDPGAVLIRGLQVLDGEDVVRENRGSVARRDWTNGPGRLTRALGISREDNREVLFGNRFLLMDDGYEPAKLMKSKRVGIQKGVDKYWRFFESGHPDVSRVKENLAARRM